MKNNLRHYLLILWLGFVPTIMAQLLPYPIDTINGTAVYRYSVEKSFGLFRISKNFGITQEEIIQWNPQLEKRGLRFEEELLIPVKQKPVSTTQVDVVPPVKQEVPVVEDKHQTPHITSTKVQEVIQQGKQIVEDVASTFDALMEQVFEISKDSTSELWTDGLDLVRTSSDSIVLDTLPKETRDRLNIGLLLPLCVDILQRDETIDRFYDFYTGSLLAIYEMQAPDFPLNIYTYDIGKDNNTLRALSHDSVFCQMDMFIGTAYSAQVATISDIALKDSIYTILPFASKVPSLEHNPYLFQFNPSNETEAKALTDYLKEHIDSIHCVLIEAPEQEIPVSIRSLHEMIKTNKIPYTYTTIRNILSDSIESALRIDVENLVIINTERFSNLQALMPHLELASLKYPITLYSKYAWQKETIRIPQLYTTVFAPDSICNQEHYQDLFDYYFHHELSSQSPRYDLLGYDITKHALECLKQNNDSTPTDPWTKNYNGLQSGILFEQVDSLGGYENTYIRIVRK